MRRERLRVLPIGPQDAIGGAIMSIRALTMGVAAMTLAGIGGAGAQSVYVDQITPAPVYVTPSSDIDGYVVEQRAVPAAPVVTYEQQVVTPRLAPQQRVVTERRVIRETPRGGKTRRVITETKTIVTEPSIVTTARPIVTEPSVVAQPTIVTQPRIVTTARPTIVAPVAPAGTATYVTDSDTITNGLSTCSYDQFGRMICN
jgi:hypothetical protein